MAEGQVVARAQAEASISQRDVDFLQEPSSGFEAADVGGDLGHELGDGRSPRDVGHHGHLGMKPKRARRR